MVNLITSLLLIFGVGFSSANMDHESNINDEPLKSIDYNNGNYILNGKLTIYDDGALNISQFYPILSGTSGNFAHSYTYSIYNTGYITGDLNYIYQEDIIAENPYSYNLTGNNQIQYQKIKFEVYFVGSTPGGSLGGTHFKISGMDYYSNWWILIDQNLNDSTDYNIGKNKYVYINNCYLTNIDYPSSITDEYKEFANSDEGIKFIDSILTQNVNNTTDNPFFDKFISEGGYYSFSNNFNPWKAIQSQDSSAFEFGTPNTPYEYNSINYYLVSANSNPMESIQYFYNYSGNINSHQLKSVDIFEGYFRIGSSYYTNIRLYFDCWLKNTGYNPPYDYSYTTSSFVYASFINTQSNDESVFLTTIKYQWEYAIGTSNSYHQIGYYNPSLTPLQNYEGWSSYNGLVQFTNLHWNYYPTLEFIYSLSRPSNNYQLKSGLSYYGLLGFYPSDTNQNEATDTYNNFLNVFILVRSAFGGVLPLFTFEVLPGLYLGTLIFIPFIFMVIFALIKLFKR